ncbi:MAG: T9SS type A sorting domain-containing protein [Winogradskyella sp.]|uniref:T9SS type A sorting domain-containing protein n=1 Tax=Winogradskyella sp. TaxID=1883156 RepID=UPI0025E43F44|nr:T9SS type A sorting domain-containing protein [Winogradskyella sp.]NRB82862.1 T9SS type A sorting domain-containing protein [Winogradskyella sp.]
MRRLALILIIILVPTHLIYGQQFTLETALSSTVKESSGLLYLNNTLITHNDSENSNQLYDIDASNGNVLRTVTISNATNIDWEDLTYDDSYIYIGDFGNYQGDRTNLRVYRVAIADYFASTNVTADIINFNYSDQTDFTPNPLATNYDAEGLIHYNNNLYVFSKNWMDGNTNIYELPKTVGSHNISIIDTVVAQGLVSGATYNALTNTIVLTGYSFNGSFLIELSGFNSGLFSNGTVTKTSIEPPTDYSTQIEAIFPINTNEYYITAEENGSSSSGLYSFNTATLETSESENIDFGFYPNPAQTHFKLNRDDLKTEIYSLTGQLLRRSKEQYIDVTDLPEGIYILKIQHNSGKEIAKRLIIYR